MNDAPKSKDTDIRRYMEGRMQRDETASFEQRVVRDKVAQARLDALRNQSLRLRELFSFPAYDLSRVQANVRARNPHKALGIPPAAALLLQAAGMAAMFLLFHAMGAYIAPPLVTLERPEGRILLDSRPLTQRAQNRIVMNQQVQTTAGSQVSLVFDESNRVSLAGDTTVIVREPREQVRQVIELNKGEVWGRFTAAGQRFACVFDRATREITGSTSEFDLVCGDRALLLLPENYNGEGRPTAVLRVFRGAVVVSGGKSETKVVRGQWAVFDQNGGAVVGPQQGENFQLLRIDSSERFKDQLHWLNTEQFPLRAEHDVLELERQLRELAKGLLDYREQNVVRNADKEIEAFETQIKADLAAAKQRIAEGNPRDEKDLPPSGPLRMTDQQLVSGEAFIVGAIANWRKRTGTYPSLGAAAMTLLARAQGLHGQMSDIDKQRTVAILRISAMEQLEKSITAQEEAIGELKKLPFYDPKGEKRAAIDKQIEEQKAIRDKAKEAKGKIDLLRLKLAQLDDQIDGLKRKRVPLQAVLDAAKTKLDEIKAKQKASPYTEQKLADLKQAKLKAEQDDAKTDIALAGAREDASKAEQLAKDREMILKENKQPALAKQNEVCAKASDALLDAVLKRDGAKKALETAEAEVTRLQAELDKLPEGEREGSDIKKQLEAAKTVRDQRKSEQDAAVKSADDAQKLVEAEKAKIEPLEKAVEEQQKLVDAAKQEHDAAKAKVVKTESDAKTAEARLAQAQLDLAAMETAKTEWEQLAKDYGVATVAYEKALWEVEDNDIAQKAVSEQADPVRKELDDWLKLVAEAEASKAKIDELKVERDKSQAIDDNIARHMVERDVMIAMRAMDFNVDGALSKEEFGNEAVFNALDAKKDGKPGDGLLNPDEIAAGIDKVRDELKKRDPDAIAKSRLVKDREKLDEEYRTLSREYDALEYTRARALDEDRQLGLKQRAAIELYNKAAAEAQKKAITLLDAFCAPYKGFELGENEAASVANRRRILEVLWRLYYSAEGADSADAATASCYYVIARSGAPSEVLRALDERWRVALTEVLGKARFETASSLKAQDLVAPKK